MGLFDVGRSPDLFEDLPVCHDPAGIPDENRQQAVFNGRQVNLLVANINLPLQEIDPELFGDKNRISLILLLERRMSDSDADSNRSPALKGLVK
jgi:hypothetical protein